MSESQLYGDILKAYSHGETRLFRINAGLAWQGTVIERSPQRLILAHPRPIKLGAPGISDLIGWTSEGYRAPAVFVAIECKSKRGYPTTEQAAFLEIVTRHGGRAGIARSVEDAGLILRGET